MARALEYGRDTETPPFSWAQEIGAMPTQPICGCMSRPSLLLCRREGANSPGPCSNLLHVMSHCCTSCSKQNFCFCSTRLSRFFVCFVALVAKMAVLQHRTLVIFGAVFHRFCRTKLSRIFKFTFLIETWIRVLNALRFGSE